MHGGLGKKVFLLIPIAKIVVKTSVCVGEEGGGGGGGGGGGDTHVFSTRANRMNFMTRVSHAVKSIHRRVLSLQVN